MTSLFDSYKSETLPFLPIGIIPKDRLSRVSTRHHMVDSAGVLDSQWSGHESILPVFLALVNKQQGLTPWTVLIRYAIR